MANQELGHGRQITDSYVDVVFESLRDADFVEGNFRIYDRLEELKAVRGEHYFRTGSPSAFSELVIGEYPEDLAAPYGDRQLREAVITHGHIVRHFVFDIANDQNLQTVNELRETKKGDIVHDKDTPAHFAPAREDRLDSFVRRSGAKYNERLGSRIMAMGLLTDDSTIDMFIAETDPFVDECLLHTTPQVFNRYS
jgi:hypothetical protein